MKNAGILLIIVSPKTMENTNNNNNNNNNTNTHLRSKTIQIAPTKITT